MSKPSDVSAYVWSGQSAELPEILQDENIDKFVVIGHDWGSGIARKLYNQHPELVSRLFFCNVLYIPPSAEKFDLDATNARTEKNFWYPMSDYCYHFTAPGGYKLLSDNLERFWEVLHGAEDDWMKKMFNSKDGMRNYLPNEKGVELRSYAKDPKWKDEFLQRMSKDGFQALCNWYKTVASNVQWEDDKNIPKEKYVVKVPFFFLGCTGDSTGRNRFD